MGDLFLQNVAYEGLEESGFHAITHWLMGESRLLWVCRRTAAKHYSPH